MEGTLRRGLVALGLAASPATLHLEVASRTDRGVSARANVLALTSDLDGARLLRALNGVAPEIFATAATPAPPGFRVRHARRRVYRYYEVGADRDFHAWAEAAPALQGAVDVRSFGRGVVSREPVWRTVESIVVTPRRGGAVVEVRAPSFVWGMVRKLVGALREHERRRLPLERLTEAAQGRVRLSLPMAEPEGLVLWSVEYPLRWEFRWQGPNRHQRAYATSAYDAWWVRRRVLRSIAPYAPARPHAGGPARP